MSNEGVEQDKKGNILSISFDKLIDELVDSSPNKTLLSEAVLTFTGYTSSEEFAEALSNKYGTVKSNPEAAERCLSVFQYWIEENNDIIVTDSRRGGRALKIIEELRETLIQEGSKSAEKLSIQLSGDKHFPSMKDLLVFPQLIFEVPSIQNVPAEVIAQQLTLIEWDLFKRIRPWEIQDSKYIRDPVVRAPNLHRMVKFFDVISLWALNEIVAEPDAKNRANVFSKMVKILTHLEEYKSYNALVEILCATESVTVSRMKLMLAALPKGVKATYDKIKKWGSLTDNYKKLRTQLQEIEPPCIPYIGMYNRDLIYIDEAHPSKRPNGLLDWERRAQQAKIIMTIKECQKTPYNFRPDKLVQEWILFRARRGAEKYVQLSRYLEPGQQNEGTPREIMTVEEKAKDRLKLVFFGPAGSGKSTLYKQWYHNARGGVSVNATREAFLESIFNCAQSFASLLENVEVTEEDFLLMQAEIEAQAQRTLRQQRQDHPQVRGDSITILEGVVNERPALPRLPVPKFDASLELSFSEDSTGIYRAGLLASLPKAPTPPPVFSNLETAEEIMSLHDQRAQYAREQCVRAIESYAIAMKQLLAQQLHEIRLDKDHQLQQLVSLERITTDYSFQLASSPGLITSGETATITVNTIAESLISPEATPADSQRTSQRRAIARKNTKSRLMNIAMGALSSREKGGDLNNDRESTSPVAVPTATTSTAASPSALPDSNLTIPVLSLTAAQLSDNNLGKTNSISTSARLLDITSATDDNTATSENAEKSVSNKIARRASGSNKSKSENEDNNLSSSKDKTLFGHSKGETENPENTFENRLSSSKEIVEKDRTTRSRCRGDSSCDNDDSGNKSDYDFGSPSNSPSRSKKKTRPRRDNNTEKKGIKVRSSSALPVVELTNVDTTETYKNTDESKEAALSPEKSRCRSNSKKRGDAIENTTTEEEVAEKVEEKLAEGTEDTKDPKKPTDHFDKETLAALTSAVDIDAGFATKFAKIWKHPLSPIIFAKHRNQFPAFMTHFFNHIERVVDNDYQATQEDVLYFYQPTGKVTNFDGKILGRPFSVVDCGGKEKRRWPTLFEGKPHWVVFVVALDEYCVVPKKRDEKNGLLQGLEDWQELTATPQLISQGVSFILLLNKEESFHEKLQETPFTVFEPSFDPMYARDSNYCTTWIADRFRGLFKGGFMVTMTTSSIDKARAEDTLDKIFKLGY